MGGRWKFVDSSLLSKRKFVGRSALSFKVSPGWRVGFRGIEFTVGPGPAPWWSGGSLISTIEGGGDQELSFGFMAPGGRGGELFDFLLLLGSMGTGRTAFELGWASVGCVSSEGWIKPFSFPGSSSEVGFATG